VTYGRILVNVVSVLVEFDETANDDRMTKNLSYNPTNEKLN
jgi:hypothetical protein